MFDQLLAMVNLGEKLPEAVGWRFVGPCGLSLPEEVLEALDEAQVEMDSSYTGSALVVYNYSGVSKSEIRVLYSGGFEFRPKVSYGRRNVPVKWEHDSKNNEFIFYDTPPNEKIEIELFNVYRGFSVDQVLVDGRLITEFMNKRALVRAYPELHFSKAMIIGFFVLCAAVTLVFGYAGYAIYKRNQDNELLSEIPVGFSRCTLSVYDNPPGEISREALARKIKKMEPWMKQILLAKNNVASEVELYDLDRVVLCIPDKA